MQLDFYFMLSTFFLAIKALPITMGITVISLLAAVPIGFFMALCRIYRISVLNQISTVYISFIRGTPIVLQILIVYSLVPSLLNGIIIRMGWQINIFNLNPVVYACLVFSLNNAALLAELFRSGLLAVDRDQYEAALSAGLTPAQSYCRIIIPQALVSSLPNISNLTIALIKNTSLVFLMTVKDITATVKIAASYGYNYAEAYLDIFIIYILICGLTQLLFMKLEHRFNRHIRQFNN
jgi:L-cystine transport system permease protein